MTISLAWIRRVDKVSELIIATDSRLAFGCRWDCCPKILALPRGDSVLCFAGDTKYAYPVMLQAIAAVSQHSKSLNRGLDLYELKGRLLRILNGMVSLIHDLPKGVDLEPDTTFLLAGWSWQRRHFKVWLLQYDHGTKEFGDRSTNMLRDPSGKKILSITGDYQSEYRERLLALLRQKNKLEFAGFDMEPFEVLRDMLRSNSFDLIGGAPQVMKVYKYCSLQPYAVFWPDRASGEINILGRPLLHYEKSPYLVLDPDTLETVKHLPEQEERQEQREGIVDSPQ